MWYFTPEKKKYITRGIDSNIPLLYQMLMFAAIDDLKASGMAVDYLQVFEFSIGISEGKMVQVIEHRQEIPKYSRQLIVPIQGEEIKDKVFVIDDGADYVTMLLASEY